MQVLLKSLVTALSVWKFVQFVSTVRIRNEIQYERPEIQQGCSYLHDNSNEQRRILMFQ